MDWFDRIASFLFAEGAHGWASRSIRERLASGPDLQLEAARLTECDFAGVPDSPPDHDYEDDGPSVEQQKRDALSTYLEMLTETESRLWGLGVVGLYQQWERDVKGVAHDLDTGISLGSAVRFKELVRAMKRLGFDFEQSPAYDPLVFTRRIANTVKHGRCDDFDCLVASLPKLFRRSAGVQTGKRRPRPEDLVVDVAIFDECARAIGEVWRQFEAAIESKRASESPSLGALVAPGEQQSRRG